MRLRQVVLAAPAVEPLAGELRAALGLGEPYADPGVALFGLHNAVLPLGDDLVEVVAPAREGTAVGRHLARGGAGYMVLVEVEDLPAARARAEAAGVREAWAIELDDIAAVHLHPADTGGAILSLDAPVPPGSWRWAGPGWAPGREPAAGLAGATLAVPDPERVAARWRDLLGAPPATGAEAGPFRFVEGDAGLCEVALRGRSVDLVLGGVRFRGGG